MLVECVQSACRVLAECIQSACRVLVECIQSRVHVECIQSAYRVLVIALQPAPCYLAVAPHYLDTISLLSGGSGSLVTPPSLLLGDPSAPAGSHVARLKRELAEVEAKLTTSKDGTRELKTEIRKLESSLDDSQNRVQSLQVNQSIFVALCCAFLLSFFPLLSSCDSFCGSFSVSCASSLPISSCFVPHPAPLTQSPHASESLIVSHSLYLLIVSHSITLSTSLLLLTATKSLLFGGSICAVGFT